MKEKLTFAGFEVEIDPENMRFDDQTLTAYLTREGELYDHYGAYLSMAERNLQNKELHADKLYCERFQEAKDMGGSDKLAEAKAKSDPDVVRFREEEIGARYIVTRLKQHLRAWDKNHDNAQNLGYTLRKQLEKLGNEIVMRQGGYRPGLDRAVEEAVRPSEFETSLTADNLRY